MKPRHLFAVALTCVAGCSSQLAPARRDPYSILDHALPADAAGLGWACFDNHAVLDDSGCGRSMTECRAIARIRSAVDAEYGVPFHASPCEFVATPICFAFKDADLSWAHFRCFTSTARCRVALLNLPADSEPISQCREIDGEELVPGRAEGVDASIGGLVPR
jgi:hypothetical protein